MKQKLNRDPKRLQPLKRPVRLLRRVLSYNIDKAIRAAASGNTPFPTNTVEYAWDPVVPFGNSTFATPFSTMFQGGSEDPPDLNQSVYSMSSILTTISVIEEKIKNDPDGFVSQCQRVRKTLINCIPTEDQLAQLNGEHLRKIVMKIEHGLNKLDQYQKVIEDYFENNDNNLSDAQTRSLDLLMTSMQSTSLEMMAVQGKIKKIQESVELDERKSANPAFSFPSLLSGSDGTTVLQSHLTPSLPKSSVQFLPSRLFVSSNSSTVVSSLASSLTSSVPIASTFVAPSNIVGNVQFSTGSPITHLVNSNVMSSNIPSTGYQIPHQALAPPLDSSSVILEAESWKSFQFQSQNVLERLVLDDMYALAELLEQELTSNLTDGELKGIDSRKAKDVSKLQKSLIEKIVKIEATADSRTKPLIENCLAANDEANNWIRSLSKMMESREMWYESSKSLGCPLKLEPFDGYNSKMNVFEFIKVFKIITRNISPKDAADYLYQNYLSADLQSMCKHVRHSFSDLSSLLVRRFGDPTRLLDDRKKQVKALPFPQRQNREQLMKYFKSLSEILDQLESLVNEHSMEFPQLQSEIYSHSCHSEIVRLLPEFIKKDYMEQYVTKCETLYDGDDLTGKESYSLLSKFIHRQFRQSQLLTEKYSEEKDKDKSSSKKPGVNFRSSPSSSCPAVRTAKQIGEDKWCQSVCFMHNTLNRRIRDCPMGKCDKFLNASPKERAAKAAEFGLCSCCFLFKCFKKSRGKFCSYKSEVPTLVVCQPCAVKGIDINVLLCSLHKSDVASVRKALTTFLPEYEENTSIKMFTFRIFNANLETPIPSIAVKQPSGEEKVFDVCQGTVVEKQDVLNKIVPETIEDSIYLLQQLSFNGRAVTVLYDTGASASAVQGDFACEAGFKIVDSTPRVICVAGGGEVSTGYGIFSCILGPSEQGQYVPVSLLGMRRITSEIPQYNLSAMEKEVKIASQGSTIAKEQFPKYVGGDEIKMIIGIKDSYLMPKLLMTLPSGLMVFRSSIKDVYGSNLMFGGPHHSVTQLHKSLASGINNFRVMFANEYKSYRNALDLPCYFLPKSCGIDADNYDSVVPFSSIHATVEEDEPVPVKNCGLVGGPACSCKEGEILDLDYDFCRCCYFPGDSKVIDQLDSDLVSDDICILNANQLNSRVLVDKDIGIFNANLNSFSEETCDKLSYSLGVTKPLKPKALERRFEEEEDIGSKITYRCARCVGCEACKAGNKTREVSIQEIMEEEIINKSIDIDLEKKTTFSRFPFRCDPIPILKKLWNSNSNERMALKVFEQQRRKAPEVRAATVKFHREVAEKGFVVPFKSLGAEIQEMIMSAEIRHYFLWRSVFKASLSTPCRVVVDPSQSGLNSVLCKGVNCLNSLYMIVINWRSWLVGFCGDISKMYNTIKLYPSEYPYSLYLWSDTLDPNEEIQIWLYVVVTYGVVSSGNITTAALRRIASMFKERFPAVFEILTKFTYMDDISHGCTEKTDAEKVMNDIQVVIANAGFKLKMWCISGEAPCEKASSDGINTSFAGYLWAPLQDHMSIGLTEINYNKRNRGVKKDNDVPVETVEQVEDLTRTIPLTRRILLGKVMELYDIIGIVEIIKAKLKIDMKEIVKYNYDEVLPDNLQQLWVSNIALIHRAREIKLQRSFVPNNAVNPEALEIIVFCDAAQVMCGVIAYCRMLLRDGSYELRFITARSKSVSHTIPRNELEACVLAAETLFCLMKALGSRCVKYWILTDSEIALCWISNESKPLKQFVFNRVQHIRFLIDINYVLHVPGNLNPSDVLTKGKNVPIEEMQPGGLWQNGPDWARSDEEFWPVRSYNQLCGNLTEDQNASYEKEFLPVPGIVEDSISKNFHCCFSDLKDCHCHMDEKCCVCLKHEVKSCTDQILDKVSFMEPSESTSSLSQVISQVTAFLSVGLSKDDVCAHFETVQIHQDLPSGSANLSAFKKKNEGNNMALEPKHPFIVEPVTRGFKLSFLALSYIMRFVSKLKHRLHLKHREISEVCHVCKLQFLPGDTPFLLGINTSSQLPGREGVFLSQYDCFLAWKTVCRIATLEVKEVLTKSQRANYEESKEGILYYGGRLSQLHEIKNTFYEKFQFVRPVALVTSQLTYAVVMHMHWLHNHPGVELLLQMVLQVIYVEKLRTLVKFIRKSCPRCRYLLKKTIKVEVSNQHQLAYSSAPPFYSAQIDVACGFLAHDVRQRVTKAAYILVIVCNLTSAVSLTVLEDLSTDQVVFGLERHAARHGWPVFLLPDKQSSFVKLEDLRISFRDLQGKLFQSKKIVLDFCTPNNHAEHGRVESRVKIVKSIFEKVAELGKKHSYIEWETVVQRTAASMNSLPIARSGDSRNPNDLEDFGLITPYHFLLGFNPNRILDTSVSVINSRCKMLEVVQNTQDYLHEVLLNHIHRFIPYHNHQFRDKIPDPGDIVLFIHVDSSRARNRDWKFGRIVENYVDGNPGKVRILYRNANETTFRETTRNLKDVCLISTLDEISFNTEEHRLAMEHQKKYLYMK